MRLVQITVSSEEETTVHRVLKNYNADYIETDETSDRNYSAVIYVPLPKNAVEPLLEELRNAGISQDGITVIVEASTIESNKFNELQEKYAENKMRSELQGKNCSPRPKTSFHREDITIPSLSLALL